MEKTIEEELLSYLTPRRMMSLKNLADQFDRTVEEITPVILQLELENKVRAAMSRCSSDCSSCSSCGPEDGKTAELSETTIIISLEKRDCDE